MRKMLLGFVLVVATLFTNVMAEENPKAVIIFDASGSMWGQINGKTKIEIARDALKNVLREWNPNVELGLTVYGHRTKGDCNDIESVIPVGKVDKNRVVSIVMSIKPKGKTPISRSLRKVAKELRFTEEKATIILISDGKETCDPDPCGTAKELEKEGIDFVTHVIGFNVDKNTDKQLECIAHATGGEYFSAKNATALNKAMKVIVKKVEVVTPPKPVVKKKKHNLVVTASEIEGGKLVQASCGIYNEDKSNHWGMTIYKKEAESHAKELPVGKYTLDCEYNYFKRKDIPVEIKTGETSKVHIVFGQTGKVYATARETEGVKLINASCRLYNEDKSDSWSVSPKKKTPEYYARQVPVGKYTLNCSYNAFKRKDIPVEVKVGETAHVDVVFGQTGKVYATARETEGGKLINASCRLYNEDKSDSWSVSPKKKTPEYYARQVPVGKYTLNCSYNAFKKKDIPVEIKAGEMAHVNVVFSAFLLTSKCSSPNDNVSYEIYAKSGELVFDKKTTCSKKIKVTLGEGAYSIEGKVKDAKAITKIDVSAQEYRSAVLDFTKQNHEEEIEADAPTEKSSKETSKSSAKMITVGDKVINIEGLSDEQIKKLKDMQQMLQMFGNKK